jgi:hypothetical protein
MVLPMSTSGQGVVDAIDPPGSDRQRVSLSFASRHRHIGSCNGHRMRSRQCVVIESPSLDKRAIMSNGAPRRQFLI